MTRKFTEDHEWVEISGDVATVGITNYAQEQLGDVVYVELPETGTEVKKGDTFGTVESVKVASDIYAPLTGEVVEVNNGLSDAPELLNSDAEGDGWIIKIKLSDSAEADGLMSADAYAEHTK